MIRIVVCLVLGLALAGCTSSAETAQIAAKEDAACQSYGYKPGSDAYVNCRTQLAATRQQLAAAKVHAKAAILSEPTHCELSGTANANCY
jgi:hypothetical protein